MNLMVLSVAIMDKKMEASGGNNESFADSNSFAQFSH